ncbi:hypothetical protein BDW59DRAFT_140331 [Aspergillus cavernicola]|uniref:Uncharacterized protein n=1 Tax=Aspergillus cavernicola TaxID=176166 RepID=A0ABR4ITI1_9EURO
MLSPSKHIYPPYLRSIAQISNRKISNWSLCSGESFDEATALRSSTKRTNFKLQRTLSFQRCTSVRLCDTTGCWALTGLGYFRADLWILLTSTLTGSTVLPSLYLICSMI